MTTIPQKSAASMSTVALAVTQGKGATAVQIGEVVSGWKHLTGADLMKTLIEFGNGVTKASAHLLVSWADKGFATVMSFLNFVKQLQDPRQRADLLRQMGLGHLVQLMGPGYG